jgi:hypothetical protein
MYHNSNSDIDIPLSEKVKDIPGFFGIHLEEQAPYDILKSDAGIEVRCYRPQTQAKVAVHGEFKEAQKEAFSLLAGYIFGENAMKDIIPMTTPVLLEQKIDHRTVSTQDWIMSFILPQNYLITNAPNPTNARISIQDRPEHLVASISYAGFNNEEKIEEYTMILKKWLNKRPWYIPMSGFQTAQFDGPLTIPFFRKNEIHVEVKHLH